MLGVIGVPRSDWSDYRLNDRDNEATKYYPKTVGKNVRKFFISAEEVEWDYAGYGQR